MRALSTAALIAGCVALSSSSALASSEFPGLYPGAAPVWHVTFDGHAPEPVAIHSEWLPAFVEPAAVPSTVLTDLETAVQGAPPPKAYVYSDSYEFRHKVHKYAAWATGPLFAAQAIVGAKLYDGDASSGVKDAHSVLAGLTGALFAVNTVTGVWNLWEGRDNPNGRTRRLVHGLLMLGADAAFLATASTAPDSEDGEVEGSKSQHRNWAVVGFSSASVAYVLMLLRQ